MNKLSKDIILDKLRKADKSNDEQLPTLDKLWEAPILSHKEKVALLISNLEKVFTDVICITNDEFPTKLEEVVKKEGIKSLMFGEKVWFENILKSNLETKVDLVPFKEKIETEKEKLFGVCASITSTYGAIAENGTVIIKSSLEEPRTLSLVPPIHIAVLKAEDIYSSLLEVAKEKDWDFTLPTNLVLVASPSRTADIELVLAKGVHGPKKFIVIILEDN